MILSNQLILESLRKGYLGIAPLEQSIERLSANERPFNTSSIDLRLGSVIQVPHVNRPMTYDLAQGGSIAQLLEANSKRLEISDEQPFNLKGHQFILANTIEKVDFSLPCNFSAFPNSRLAARVEGKSSLARCGLLVHFTAPTIHTGFKGNITLEMINLGPCPITLRPGMPICQLIIEVVWGEVSEAPNQFSGQSSPSGVS